MILNRQEYLQTVFSVFVPAIFYVQGIVFHDFQDSKRQVSSFLCIIRTI